MLAALLSPHRGISQNQNQEEAGNMRIRKLATLGILAVALAIPGISLAKNDKKAEKNATGNGVGKGGVPAALDALQDQIDSALRRIRRLEHGLADTNTRVDALEDEVADLDSRVEALEGQFVDDDGDTFSEVQDDCDDANEDVNPLAAEVPGNLIDDDCDHLIDEV
jgi:septal ring factor EnvC (AmiA/AmiB activator)